MSCAIGSQGLCGLNCSDTGMGVNFMGRQRLSFWKCLSRPVRWLDTAHCSSQAGRAFRSQVSESFVAVAKKILARWAFIDDGWANRAGNWQPKVGWDIQFPSECLVAVDTWDQRHHPIQHVWDLPATPGKHGSD